MTAGHTKVAMASEVRQADTGWKVQLLRLTLFLSKPLEATTTATLWKSATGEEPEVDDNRPREQVRQQGGSFGNCRLDVAVSPTRVDWVMSPIIAPNMIPQQHFASIEEAADNFIKSGTKWLQIGAPSATRVAIGAILLVPATNKHDAYQTLGAKLKKVQVDPDHSSDLFYQINWPKESTAMPPLQLNRLTKWSSHAVRSANFQFTSEGQVITNLNAPEDISYFCRLECDHNTIERHSEPFTQEQAKALFEELWELVMNNARDGEIVAEA